MVKKGLKFLILFLGVFIIGISFISAALTFITIPQNLTGTNSLWYGNQSLAVNFNATNGTGFNSSSTAFSINDSRFTINTTGYLQNASPMAVGSYALNVTVNLTYTEGANISTMFLIQINKSQNYDCGVYFNTTSPITYPAYFIAYTNCSSAYNLTVNGAEVINDSVINSGVATYNVSVQRTDAANFTNVFDSQLFTINKNTENCQVLYNTTSPITYPATFLAWANCTSAFVLSKNGTTISNDSVINSGWGAYNISFLRTDTQNYSYVYNESQFIVSKSPEKFKVLFNASSGITFPDTFLAWANSTSVSVLRINGTVISNNSVQNNIAAGTYNFSAQRTDTANYTYTYNDTSFILNKGVSVVNASVNNSRENLTLQSGTHIWLNGSLVTGTALFGSLGLLVDGNSQNSSANVTSVSAYYTGFIALGFHNVTASYTGNQNYTSSEETFNVTVIDTTAPTYSVSSPNNTEIGQPTLFSIDVNDNTALNPNDKYIFSTNDSGVWVNDSGVNFTTTPEVISVVKTMNKTLGKFIGYRWFFNDTSNNMNATPIYVLTTTADVTSPTYSGNAIVPDTTYAGRTAGFTIDVTDIIALETNGQYIFSTNDSGVWVNDSGVNFTTTSEIARSVKTLNSTIGKVVGYRWYFSDNSSNTNSTPIYSLTITRSPSSGSGSTTGGTSSPATTYTTDSEFANTGDKYNMKVSDKINFVIGSSSHSLKLNQFNSTAARVTIASTPISATLQKGVLYSYDLSGDGVNDINVRYDGIVGAKAVIFVQGIAPVVNPPAEEPATTPPETTNTNTDEGTPATTPTENTTSPWKTVIIIVAILVIALIVVLLISKKQKTKRHYMYGY